MADLEKLVDELSSLTILEAAELKDRLEEKWGVTAASGGGMMMMTAPVDGGDAAEDEAKTEFDVVLADVGPKKINVIKAVRGLTTLGLREAKALVEETPSTVMEAVSKEAAEDAKAKLEAEGAKVDVK